MRSTRPKPWILFVAASLLLGLLGVIFAVSGGSRRSGALGGTLRGGPVEASSTESDASAGSDLKPLVDVVPAGASDGEGAQRAGRVASRRSGTIVVTARFSPGGTLAAEAPVCLVGRGIERGVTDKLGRATFEVPPGEYFVGVDPPLGSKAVAMQLVEDAVGELAEAKVTVGPGETHDLALYVQSGSFFMGRVLDTTGSPVHGIVALRFSPLGPSWMSACRVNTDVNGFFETPPIFAGTYTVESSNDVGPLIKPTELVVGLAERSSVTLEAASLREVEVELRIICRPSGKPWPLPALARIKRSDELAKVGDEGKVRARWSEPSSEGHVFSTRLRPGPYDVSIRSLPWGGGSTPSATKPFTVRQSFELKPRQSRVLLEVEVPDLGELATLQGAVAYDGDDVPDLIARYIDEQGETDELWLSIDDERRRYRLAFDLSRLSARRVEIYDTSTDFEALIGTADLSTGDQSLDLRAVTR